MRGRRIAAIRARMSRAGRAFARTGGHGPSAARRATRRRSRAERGRLVASGSRSTASVQVAERAADRGTGRQPEPRHDLRAADGEPRLTVVEDAGALDRRGGGAELGEPLARGGVARRRDGRGRPRARPRAARGARSTPARPIAEPEPPEVGRGAPALDRVERTSCATSAVRWRGKRRRARSAAASRPRSQRGEAQREVGSGGQRGDRRGARPRRSGCRRARARARTRAAARARARRAARRRRRSSSLRMRSARRRRRRARRRAARRRARGRARSRARRRSAPRAARAADLRRGGPGADRTARIRRAARSARPSSGSSQRGGSIGEGHRVPA